MSISARLTVLLVLAILLGACLPRYGDEWRSPSASGLVAALPGTTPVVGARVSHPDESESVVTADDGTFHIPGVVEKGFSLVLPASGFAWHPLRIEAEGYPVITVHLRAPLPAHRAAHVEVPPVLLARPDPLSGIDTATPDDCDDETWRNAITLWGMARTSARRPEESPLTATAYEHALTALDIAYYDCKAESPWTGRLKANELKRALRQEMASPD